MGHEIVDHFFQQPGWKLKSWLFILVAASSMIGAEYYGAETVRHFKDENVINLGTINRVNNDSRNNTAMIPPKSKDLFDLGFYVTQPIYEHFSKDKALADHLADANTVYSLVLVFYAFAIAILFDLIGVIFTGTLVFALRCLCGLCTAMPVHSEYIASDGDWPNCLWGGGIDSKTGQSTDTAFFTFFSGHVAVPMLVAHKLWANGKKSGYNELGANVGFVRKLVFYAIHFLNFVQIVRLLGTRGHWTIDIIVGVCMGMWGTRLVSLVDAAIERGKFQKSL